MKKTTMPKRLLATKGIINNNHLLGIALGATLDSNKHANSQAVLAWGKKPSAMRAYRLAQSLSLPLITVEDGFLRSLDGGVNSKFAASFVADDQGIYFDSLQPNLLQTLIAKIIINWDGDKSHQSRALIDKIIAYQLSKYNATKFAPSLTQLAGNDKNHVLIIDQVKNDASVAGAGAIADDFYAMIAHAKDAYPNANIWIKAHPEGKGYFTDEVQGVYYLKGPCNSIALLGQAVAVYTVSSHMGFEALLLGKKVHCFGVNWYAGFGLTDDSYLSGRQLYQNVCEYHQQLVGQYDDLQNVTIEQLFYASYVLYSHYANPATKQACDIETVIDYLALNRDWQSRLAGSVLVYDFSRWKVPFVREFLDFPRVHLSFSVKKFWANFADFLRNMARAYDDVYVLKPFLGKSNRSYVTWGIRSKRHLAQKLAKMGEIDAKIWCMEDGFIRSNGLGASLIAPLSVVMDDVGIYYDATAPSRLEMILTNIVLTDEQKLRANQLRQLLLTKRVSKYNVGVSNENFINKINDLRRENPKAVIRLVVGQVEDDASVQSCASVIVKNADLLAKVRADFADDVIIYKPHPDVEAGLRVGRVDDVGLADVVASDVAMPDCLDVCDVVHTISSLTGFEALLRGREVVCYGMPFYAGFGLTADVIESDNILKITALKRRKRTPLTIEALIFGVLIEYPLYHVPDGHGLATPEDVIEYLYSQPKSSQRSWYHRLWQRVKTGAMRFYNDTKQ